MVTPSEAGGKEDSAVAPRRPARYLSSMKLPWAKIGNWALAGVVLLVVTAVPLLHMRTAYEQHKRLRVVTDGRAYRSGQMTADGFREACKRYGIRTVLNLQDDEENTAEDERDPHLPKTPFVKSKQRESEVLAGIDVKYVQLDGNALNTDGAGGRPKLVDDFLKVMDDESNYPVLLHCKAGLHRTGLMTAIYRMEYEGRSREEALDELKANGFGEFKATDDNVYVKKYIFEFEPGQRVAGYEWPKTRARGIPVGGGCR